MYYSLASIHAQKAINDSSIDIFAFIIYENYITHRSFFLVKDKTTASWISGKWFALESFCVYVVVVGGEVWLMKLICMFVCFVIFLFFFLCMHSKIRQWGIRTLDHLETIF